MENWRKVWREGFSKIINKEHKKVLLNGLLKNDSDIVQGTTVTPPPLMCVQDWPAEATDVISYGAWKSGQVSTVGEVEEYFAKCCYEVDKIIGEPAACRWFLNWYDDTPRNEMISLLSEELELDRQ